MFSEFSYQECIDDCNKALLLQGTRTDISKSYYRMALAYEALGNIDAAMKHSAHLVKGDSSNSNVAQLFDRINARYNESQKFGKNRKFINVKTFDYRFRYQF